MTAHVAAPPDLNESLATRWARLSLATRFAAAGGVVLVVATLIIGALVTSRIEDTVVRNAANATALYMDSTIGPIIQQVSGSGELAPGAERALHEVFASTPLGERVVAFKFWTRGGMIMWSYNDRNEGRTFPVTDDLRQALAGDVVASFNDLHDEESSAEAELGLPLLEVYLPVRAAWSGQVIAVAEFYEVAEELAEDLQAARRAAWAAVAATTLALGAVLYMIVLGGSRTIEAQRRALDQRLGELRDLSMHNEELRLRVQAAAARAATQADRTMRRIGADLHDGPAQHLAYATLRLDALRERVDGPVADDLGRVAGAVTEALGEVRALSRGLQLSDIADRPLPAIIEAAVEAHEARSSHPVAVRQDCGAEPALNPAARVCVFRFLQEGLSNASRHAGGQGLEVALSCPSGRLQLAVRDQGPGLPARPREGGMGLSGLRDRIESLGGTFAARNRPEGGTEIAMTLDTRGPAWT